jgi:cytochrome c biogenesis protein CcdA
MADHHVEQTRQHSRWTELPMYLGYAVSVVTFGFGAIIVSGYMIDPRLPAQFRYTFGVVMILMGVYRFVLTREKIRRWKTESEDEN